MTVRNTGIKIPQGVDWFSLDQDCLRLPYRLHVDYFITTIDVLRGYEHLLELMVAIRMEIGTKLREVTTA